MIQYAAFQGLEELQIASLPLKAKGVDMATRCLIVLEGEDYRTRGILCANDGYPAGVGTALVSAYNTVERAEALVENGNITGIRFSLENLKLCHKEWEKCAKSKGKPFRVLRSASLDDTEAGLHPYIKELMAQHNAKYLYWGVSKSFPDGTGFVQWVCVSVEGFYTNLYKLDKKDYRGDMYVVEPDGYGLGFYYLTSYLMGSEGEKVEKFPDMKSAYEAVRMREYAPERDTCDMNNKKEV